jgi:hypothetical protein
VGSEYCSVKDFHCKSHGVILSFPLRIAARPNHLLYSPSGQPVCSRCWLAVRAPSCKPELGARLLGGADTAEPPIAINWIFCRSSAALRGWPLARRSQLKLMYGDHHQQPQKDCRYNEPNPFLVVREPCMRMIGPVHGQPTFHAAPNPTPYHTSYGLMTEHRGGRPWQRAMLHISGQPLPQASETGPGSPGLQRSLSRGSPIRDGVVPGVVPIRAVRANRLI